LDWSRPYERGLKPSKHAVGRTLTFELRGGRRGTPLFHHTGWLYHIVHEALNNVLKHSNAKQVQVDLQIQDTNVHLEICDDGVGFTCAPNGTAGGLGLPSIKERSQRLGGQLQIESSPGHGARVLIDVPISPARLSDTVFHSSQPR
jgi:nitrate/nitrite-specific signal transduction histidine kinase